MALYGTSIVKDITKAEQSQENTYLPSDSSKAETMQLATNVVSSVKGGIDTVTKDVDQDTERTKLLARLEGTGSSSGTGRGRKLNMAPLADAAIQLRDIYSNSEMNSARKQLYADKFHRWAFSQGYSDDDVKGVSDSVGLNIVASKTVRSYEERQAQRADKVAARREEEAMKMFPYAPNIETALESYDKHQQASLILSANNLGKGITPTQVKTAMFVEVSDLFRANENALGNNMLTQDLVRLENAATEQLVQQYKVDPSVAREVAANVRDAYEVSVKNNAGDLEAAKAQTANYASIVENEQFLEMASQKYTVDIKNSEGKTVDTKVFSGGKLNWLAKNAPEAFKSFMMNHPEMNTQLGKAMLASSISSDTAAANMDSSTAAAYLQTVRSKSMLNTIKSAEARDQVANGTIGGLKKVFETCAKERTLAAVPFEEYNRTLDGVNPEVFSTKKEYFYNMSNEAIVANAGSFDDSVILVDSNGNPRIGKVYSDGSFETNESKIPSEALDEFNSGRAVQTKKFIKNYATLNGISIDKAAEEYNKMTLMNSKNARVAYKVNSAGFDILGSSIEAVPTDAFIKEVSASLNGVRSKDSKREMTRQEIADWTTEPLRKNSKKTSEEAPIDIRDTKPEDWVIPPATGKLEGETQVNAFDIDKREAVAKKFENLKTGEDLSNLPNDPVGGAFMMLLGASLASADLPVVAALVAGGSSAATGTAIATKKEGKSLEESQRILEKAKKDIAEKIRSGKLDPLVERLSE